MKAICHSNTLALQSTRAPRHRSHVGDEASAQKALDLPLSEAGRLPSPSVKDRGGSVGHQLEVMSSDAWTRTEVLLVEGRENLKVP